jgi:beta-ribofuranosylaminobenzene 5'-phosphate synthase
MKRIAIITPSRLHLGLIDLNGNLGRLYGSIGVAVEEPKVVLEAEQSDKLEINGKDKVLVSSVIRKVSSFYGLDDKIRINVKETIPRHSGLGSGTQTSLAVATAYCGLKNIKTSAGELAFILGRGAISGIGTAAFARGGFILDSGINVLHQIPAQPLIQRRFPKDWRFIVVVPNSVKGFSGKKEMNAFKKIIPGPEKNASEISRLSLMKLLPALLEEDIQGFGWALTEIDKKTGDYFRKAQNGTYNQTETEKTIKLMLALGAYGAGQSSWGPASYALTDKDSAQDFENSLRAEMKGNKLKAEIITTKANNMGAKIKNIK